MLIKSWLAIARACYALVVVVSSIFGACCALLALAAFPRNFPAWASSAIIASILLFLVSCVVIRKWRRGALISHPSDHGQWMFVFFLTVAGTFGHLLVFAVGHAFYHYRYVHPEKDVEGGPMAFFLMIATGCYIIALLMGEFGLKHRAPAQARISPASGLADALSGNTPDSSAADDTPR